MVSEENNMMFDSHCHVQFKAFDEDREDVLSRCAQKGMILNVVGTQQKTSALAVEFAERYDWVYASIGLHPIQEYKKKIVEESTEFMAKGEDFDEAYYEELVQSPKVIAIGETGLDRFHVPKDVSTEEVMERQKHIFLQHYHFAKKHDLPLVIHVRDAHEDMLALLRAEVKSDGSKVRGVIHCYTGNWEYAEEYLDLGLYLGFTGVITFPPKKTDPQPQHDLFEVIEKIPIERMLVETDSPYLAPQSYRGKRAEPWMVEEVIKKIAEIKGVAVEDAEEAIYSNTKQLFDRTK
jgi:TatD DNase family protein